MQAFIPDVGKGVQGATSHCLGQNFAKMFDVKYQAEDKQEKYVWQTSWGCTTRTLGVMVMTHSDDKGLVIPPRVSRTQVCIQYTPPGTSPPASVLQAGILRTRSCKLDPICPELFYVWVPSDRGLPPLSSGLVLSCYHTPDHNE